MNKAKYRVRNWKDYNRSLQERGSIEVWFDKAALKNWHPQVKKGQRGRPQEYSEAVIKCALVVKYVFRLGFRQLQGFLRSLIAALGEDLTEPNYTTVCKRQNEIDIDLITKHKRNKKLFLLVDASGLKVYGEGEWKVRMHGYSKRRTWRKLHIGVGITSSGQARVEAMKLTGKEKTDQEIMPDLLDQVEGEIDKIIGDGAYDTKRCHRAAIKRKAKMIAPPRKGATTNYTKTKTKSPWFDGRNKTVRFIYKYGEEAWKKATRYHKRSLVENMFFRFKTALGEKMNSRKFENQEKEALIKCAIINRMSELGMPESYKVV